MDILVISTEAPLPVFHSKRFIELMKGFTIISDNEPPKPIPFWNARYNGNTLGFRCKVRNLNELDFINQIANTVVSNLALMNKKN